MIKETDLTVQETNLMVACNIFQVAFNSLPGMLVYADLLYLTRRWNGQSVEPGSKLKGVYELLNVELKIGDDRGITGIVPSLADEIESCEASFLYESLW